MIVDSAVIRLKCRNMTLINLVENWIKICKKFVERNQTLFFMPRICADQARVCIGQQAVKHLDIKNHMHESLIFISQS